MNEELIEGFASEVEDAKPEAEELARQSYIEMLCSSSELSIDRVVEAPPVAIYIGESPACTFGNFSASIGKPKGKKTFNVSAMTAAAMTGRTILNYRGNMPTDQNRVLYFDPEQSSSHAFRVFQRIAILAELDNAGKGACV